MSRLTLILACIFTASFAWAANPCKTINEPATRYAVASVSYLYPDLEYKKLCAQLVSSTLTKEANLLSVFLEFSKFNCTVELEANSVMTKFNFVSGSCDN